MPFLGSIIPSNAVGLAASKRAKDRERAEKKDKAEHSTTTGEARPEDVADLSEAAQTQPVDAVAKSPQNGSEEAREERLATGGYGPNGTTPKDEPKGSLDLRG